MSAPPPSPPAPPLIGHAVAFAADPFGFVREAVESTGDVFRIRLLGRDVYLVANPEHVGTALLDRDAFAKLEDFRIAFGDALLAVEGEQWHRQRTAMEGFFSPTRINEYAGTMGDLAAARIDPWGDGSIVRVDEEMRALALENLFEVVLGQSLSATDVDELVEAATALNHWFKPTSWVLPHWVPTPARRSFRAGSRDLREHARDLLSETGPTPDEDSLLATLAALGEDPDSEFTESAVLDQVVGMLFAGHETTALAMTYGLHLLGSHPQVAEEAVAEIDAVVDGRPSLAELQELTYLEQVIDETLRRYPPVHAIPRVTTERTELGDYVLPADRQVLLSVWDIHHNPRFYEDPFTFDPARWASTTTRDRGYEFVPFGAGPRICIGRHFARLEMKAVFATVLQRYELDAIGDVEVDPQMTSQPAGRVEVRVRRRE